MLSDLTNLWSHICQLNGNVICIGVISWVLFLKAFLCSQKMLNGVLRRQTVRHCKRYCVCSVVWVLRCPWTLMVTLCTTLQTDSYSQSISHFIQLTQTGFSYELWSVNWSNLFSFLGSVSVIYLDCSEMNLAGKEPEHLQKCYLTWRRKNRIL